MHKKILLVDDESALRRSMSLGLSRRGYDTEPCENGVNALKKLESYIKNNIHLDGIVVDIRLPDIDGIKLVKIMKFKYPGVPIILISGYADRYNMEEIRDLKVSAFLEKPFTADELSDQFVKILEQQVPEEDEEIDKSQMEAVSESAYILLKMEEGPGFFDAYQELYYMDNVVYCDATKGDYDIFLLLQGDNMEQINEIAQTKIKNVEGVHSLEILEVGTPILDESIQAILKDAEDALDNNESIGKERDMSRKVCSYLLMEVEREKMHEVYPAVRLDENVIYCDYATGKYNLVLLVAGNYFDDIDRFITQRLNGLDGVLKVKEYPIINLFEM